MKAELILNVNKLNKKKFFNLYSASKDENIAYFFPNLKGNEANEAYERKFWNEMKNFFEKENGIFGVLTDEKFYYSGIKIYQKENNNFFFEAFETNPKFLHQGFGSRLLYETILLLEKRFGKIKIISTTWKTNAFSIKAHLNAGFIKILNYAIEDDKKLKNWLTLEYKSQSNLKN